MQHRSFLLAALTSLFLFSACGGGGGGGSGATADVLIGDAPRDDLLSFSAVIQSVRLQRDDLSFTSDLVGTVEVEFLGLNGALAFLVKGRIPAGTYVAVEIGFVPGQYRARADDSSPVTIVAAQDTYLAALAAPLVVVAGQYVRFSVDLDLLNSLSGVVANGSIDFSPGGSCHSSDGSDDALIDELKGKVVSSSQVDGTVLVDGFINDPPVSVGRVSVHVDGSAVLLDNDNQVLTLAAFFAALVPNVTRLEVHGNLSTGGRVEATRIEIEDATGSGGDAIVRIRGIVTALAPPELSLQVAQIKDGASVAEPVLATLPDPDVIQVAFGAGTTFKFDSGALTNAGSLAIGQEVKVRFSDFVAPPFPASEIEIDDTPGFHGTLTGVGPRTETLTVHLDASDPAVREGLVASASTEVRVTLGAAALVLGVPAAPHLALPELVAGLELELHGRLSGPPSAPVIAAERVLLRPGYLRHSLLTNVAAGGGNLVVDGGEHVDSFGTTVKPGPLQVWLEDGCTFTGDVGSRAEFEALFGGQASGRAQLDVLGLGNGYENEVRAFALRVTRL